MECHYIGSLPTSHHNVIPDPFISSSTQPASNKDQFMDLFWTVRGPFYKHSLSVINRVKKIGQQKQQSAVGVMSHPPRSRDAAHVWKKIGKQKIYISAINGPSLPPKPLENRCRAFCCAELSLLFWGNKENRQICIPVIDGPSLPPKPSQTAKPPPNCHKFY